MHSKYLFWLLHFDKNCLYLLKSKADRSGMRPEEDHVNEENSRGGGGPSTQAAGLPLLTPSFTPSSVLVPKVVGSMALSLSSAPTLNILFSPAGTRSFLNSHSTPYPGLELLLPVSSFLLTISS